jgi:hypothetical protein
MLKNLFKKKQSSIGVEVPGVAVKVSNPLYSNFINRRRIILAIGLIVLGFVTILGLVFGAYDVAELGVILREIKAYLTQ